MDKEINFNKKYLIDIGAMPFAFECGIRNQFRIIANMLQFVKVDILQKAVDKIVPRFPMFTINMSQKWNSMRELIVSDMKINVQKYQAKFTPFNLQSNEPLFRVMYGKKFICVEMLHILSDANGCVAFLNSLLYCYYELLGMKMDKTNIITIDSKANKDEFEDSYFRYARRSKSAINLTNNIAKKCFKLNCGNYLNESKGEHITYSFDVEQLKSVSRKYNATINEYAVTVICLAYAKIKNDCNCDKCIRIQMPINLRKRFFSKSLRNFVATTQFETFSNDKLNILQEIKRHMSIVTSDKELESFMWNAVFMMNGVLKVLPRFIGDFLLKTGDNLLGEKASSTSFSNIGLVENNLFKNGVVSMEFLAGTPKYVPFLLSAITYNNICNLTFSKNTRENLFEKYFLEELKKDGIFPTNIVVRE